jgi:hypothetical protein
MKNEFFQCILFAIGIFALIMASVYLIREGDFFNPYAVGALLGGGSFIRSSFHNY